MNPTTLSELHIRQAFDADATALSRLICKNAQGLLKPHYSPLQLATFERYYSPEAMLEKEKKQTIFCAEIKGELVGTIGLERDFVVGFYTEVSLVNQGIGSALLDHLENFARKNGLGVIQLSASPVGVAFYERRGWQKLQDITVDYFGVGFDETLMKKAL